MKITAIKTEKVTVRSISLEDFIKKYVRKLPEYSLLVISSKIVSLTEGRVELLSQDKESLIAREADYYLPKKLRRFGFSAGIIHHAFIGAAGIDESNASGYYVLLPKHPEKTADTLYHFLCRHFKRKNIGVIITDSRSLPLRRGASGVALAYRGFVGLKDYRGKPDLFGRKLVMEQANIADALAATAVLVMGEGNEQTPLALIEDVSNISFRSNAPTKKELDEFFVNLKDDIFSPIFDLKKLKRGGQKK